MSAGLVILLYGKELKYKIPVQKNECSLTIGMLYKIIQNTRIDDNVLSPEEYDTCEQKIIP